MSTEDKLIALIAAAREVANERYDALNDEDAIPYRLDQALSGLERALFPFELACTHCGVINAYGDAACKSCGYGLGDALVKAGLA